MAEKPILFNTEDVRAILDGRKTMTRLLIKPQPVKKENLLIKEDRKGKYIWGWVDYGRTVAIKDIPYPYKPGDILYVRETWSQTRCFDCDFECDECELNIERNGKCPPDEGFCDDGYYVYYATDNVNSIDNGQIKWHPSIHMPREAARIWLKVTDVRIDRLWDMGRIDFLKEGLTLPHDEHTDLFLEMEYKQIWDSTIKKKDLPIYGWDANPWVWIIEFERIEKPEDIK